MQLLLVGIAYGLACLAYGNKGVELRKEEKRFIVLVVATCVIWFGLRIWFISFGIWLGGNANKDEALCIALTLLLPTLYLLWVWYIRRGIEAEIAEMESAAEMEQKEKAEYEQKEEEARLKREASKQEEMENPPERITVVVDRSEETLSCPNCKRTQRSDRKACYNCGAVFEDEQ